MKLLSEMSMTKRSRETNADEQRGQLCNFCAKSPTVVSVSLPIVGRKKRAPTPYCLLCYYSTSAIRQNSSQYVQLVDANEHRLQLPALQEIFSESFLELQQELAEESARAFTKQKNDPLAILSANSFSKKRRKLTTTTTTSTHNKGQAPDLFKKQEGRANDGGFLREIGLPERLKRTQEEQERIQREQLVRMNQAASAARRASRTPKNKIAQRRKGSGKSIWNLAMTGGGSCGNDQSPSMAISYKDSSENNLHSVACTCGSKDVESFGNITSRNQEVRKGEIWGTDRGEDVIHRYQCNKCGRTWNEVE